MPVTSHNTVNTQDSLSSQDNVSTLEKAFNSTRAFSADRPYNIKDDSGKPMPKVFPSSTQFKLAHCFLSQMGYSNISQTLSKHSSFNNVLPHLLMPGENEIVISPLGMNLGHDPQQIVHKMGIKRKLIIPRNRITEWESNINITLPSHLPKLFFMEFVNHVRNMNKVLYHSIASLPLKTLITLPQWQDNPELVAFIDFLKAIYQYGEAWCFNNNKHYLEAFFSLNIMQLGVGPCKFIPGCFFLDQNNQMDEQLTEVGMLYHSAIDLRQSFEFDTYFQFNSQNYRFEWKETGQKELKERVKSMLDTMLSSAQKNNVKVLSLLAAGQGEFIRINLHINKIADQKLKENISVDDKNVSTLIREIQTCYAQALFELLQENDYGLETVFYNPAQSKEKTEEVYKKSGGWNFKCNVTLHDKDAIILAKNIKKADPTLKVAFNNAGDPKGLMGNGYCTGENFEYQSLVENDTRYLVDEHLMANSTYLLGSPLITQADTEPQRVVVAEYETYLTFFTQPVPSLGEKDENQTFQMTSSNPFLKIHQRFTQPQVLEGWEQQQLKEFAVMVSELRNYQMPFDRFQAMQRYAFTLKVSLTGRKYFSARQSLIQLVGNKVNGALSGEGEINKLNINFWKPEEGAAPQPIVSGCEIAQHLFESYYQEYLSVLSQLETKSVASLSGKEKHYLEAINPPKSANEKCLVM